MVVTCMHAQLYVVVNNDCLSWIYEVHIILFLLILLFPLGLKGSIPNTPVDVTNGVTDSGSDKSKVSLYIWDYKITGITCKQFYFLILAAVDLLL